MVAFVDFTSALLIIPSIMSMDTESVEEDWSTETWKPDPKVFGLFGSIVIVASELSLPPIFSWVVPDLLQK